MADNLCIEDGENDPFLTFVTGIQLLVKEKDVEKAKRFR
jgi:hypothetical protein